MPSLIDIRRRVRAVKSTQQITRAMKMVAASKLRRSQDRVIAARPFAQQMLRVLNSLASRVEAERAPAAGAAGRRRRPAHAAHRDHGGQGAVRQLQHQRHQGRVAVRQGWSRSPGGARPPRPQGPRLLQAPRIRRPLRGRRPVRVPAVLARPGDREAGDRGVRRRPRLERLSGLQRVQERHDAARGPRAAAADRPARRHAGDAPAPASTICTSPSPRTSWTR